MVLIMGFWIPAMWPRFDEGMWPVLYVLVVLQVGIEGSAS